MYIFILAAAALALAAVIWYAQASDTAVATPPAQEEDTSQRLRLALAEDSRMAEAIAEAIKALEELMAHPEFGGPGFLMVQFLYQAPMEEGIIVTAQYPNIREGLYRRIVRQELERSELAAAGVPEALLAQEPAFETESGGIVMVTIQAGGLPPELAEVLNCRRERNLALDMIAAILRTQFPELSVRVLGADLLLSPLPDKREDVCTATTSIDE